MLKPTRSTQHTCVARRIRRLALVGAFLGLVPAVALGIFRAVNADGPFSGEAILESVVFVLIYASAYLVALYASRRAPAATQAPLLLAATIASLLESFSAMSGVSLLLLPATILLFVAAVLAFRDPETGGVWKAASAIGAIGAAAFMVASFLVLFLRDDARCWQLTTYKDGRTEWQSIAVPLPGAGISVGPAPENATRREARCSSDVITWPEALASMGLLAIGLLALAGFSRYVGQAVQGEVT